MLLPTPEGVLHAKFEIPRSKTVTCSLWTDIHTDTQKCMPPLEENDMLLFITKCVNSLPKSLHDLENFYQNRSFCSNFKYLARFEI